MDGIPEKLQIPAPGSQTPREPAVGEPCGPGCPTALAGYIPCMTRQQVLDLYFMDARSKVIDIAAFLDRVERAEGKEDFRLVAFRAALAKLEQPAPNKAKEVLLAFSDPTADPIIAATTKAACGAWPGSH